MTQENGKNDIPNRRCIHTGCKGCDICLLGGERAHYIARQWKEKLCQRIVTTIYKRGEETVVVISVAGPNDK